MQRDFVTCNASTINFLDDVGCAQLLLYSIVDRVQQSFDFQAPNSAIQLNIEHKTVQAILV